MNLIFSRIAGSRALGPSGSHKRRFQRLYTDLPIEYQVLSNQVAEPQFCSGTMKNISRGGAYLETRTSPQLSPGQVVHLTLKSLATYPIKSGIIHLAAKAVVLRVDPPTEASRGFGIAVEFLSGPLISFL